MNMSRKIVDNKRLYNIDIRFLVFCFRANENLTACDFRCPLWKLIYSDEVLQIYLTENSIDEEFHC